MANKTIESIDLPLGLLYIASNLEKHGHNVFLIDGAMPNKDYETVNNPYCENYFGITFEDIEKRIRSIDFDIVGITAQYTVQFPNAVKTAELIKRIKPDCRIIVGGAHATVQDREILQRYKCFDIAVRGEGEHTVVDIIESIRHNHDLSEIRGISYRDGSNVIVTPNREFIKNLDELPFPAYHIVNLEKYFALNKGFASRTGYSFKGQERGVSVITSRGCPYQCTFCSIHLHMGRQWRYHSPEYVLRHMEHLIRHYDVKYFHFEDDNLTASPKRFEKILDGIIEKGWRIRWDTPNGVRADTLTLDLLKKCRRTGCTHLIFGIESGSQRVLDKVICKKIKIEDIEKAAKLARRAKVNARAFYLIGTPGETKEEIRATVSHALKMAKTYDCFGGIAMVSPLYGTKVFEICKEKNFFVKDPTPENIGKAFLESGIIKTDDFTPDFLVDMLKYFNKRMDSLIKWIFWKRILTDIRILKYCIISAFTVSPSQWGYVYYKVIFFHHILKWDMKCDRAKE